MFFCDKDSRTKYAISAGLPSGLRICVEVVYLMTCKKAGDTLPHDPAAGDWPGAVVCRFPVVWRSARVPNWPRSAPPHPGPVAGVSRASRSPPAHLTGCSPAHCSLTAGDRSGTDWVRLHDRLNHTRPDQSHQTRQGRAISSSPGRPDWRDKVRPWRSTRTVGQSRSIWLADRLIASYSQTSPDPTVCT